MHRPIAKTNSQVTVEDIREWLEDVPDPEIPVLSVVDLGVVRDIRMLAGQVEVSVAPTYSGCPAMEVIERNIVDALAEKGVKATIRRVLSPPWTTDWLSENGRARLRAYGIAPPAGPAGKHALRPRGLSNGLAIACPRCAATATSRVSEFGSTPCKASYRCNECLEPFEYFKCI